MKGEFVAGIQPSLLIWARTSVGLSVADVSKILKRQSKEIEDWEAGIGAPTYAQLEKLAYQIYKRPLAVFFLPSPPEEISLQTEFRTLPDADMQSISRDTYLHIRKAHAYQLALQDLFGGNNPNESCILKTLSLSPQKSIEGQAQNIRDFLGISLERQTQWRNDESALKEWRLAIENAGIYVFKAPFKQNDISGFCLLDPNLPIIYLNNSTTKTRQIFSLLHELAHLLLSINGISKIEAGYIENLPKKEANIERFCNTMAAEILIPASDFSTESIKFPKDIEKASEDQFSALANRYGVSREAILRRFLDQGMVSNEFYQRKTHIWTQQMKQGSGGNWYLNQGAYISNRFAKEVLSRHYQNQLSVEQAADYLGIKAKNFAGFEERIIGGATA